MGGRFKREGTYVYLWLIHADVPQKPTQFCNTIILQLKIKKKRILHAMHRTWVPPLMGEVRSQMPWSN